MAVRVCPSVSVTTHMTSVSYTQDVRVCPPAHTGHSWLFVAVCQHTQDVCGCPCVSMCVCGCPPAHTGQTGRPSVSVSTHRTSMCVCVCPSAHTGRPWLSISTHISTLFLGLSTLALSVDSLGDFGPRGLSVQYTHDVRWCPSAHTGRPCVFVSTHRTSVAVRVCLCVSVSTHRTSVAVHQYTYQHVGPWIQHADPSRGMFGTHRTSVAVHQYTYQHFCPWTQHPGPSHGLFGTSMGVRGYPSAHTGRPWLSISTHISTLVLGLSTLPLPVDSSGDFGSRGLSVLYTQDVRGCPSAHTGRPWLSISRHMTSVAVCVCLCVSVSTHMTFVSVHQYTYQHYAQDVRGCPGVSVCVRQHTQDVRVYPSVHISACWTSISVRGCPAAHTGRLWLSVCVRVCLWVSASTHDVRGCQWLSVSTHRTSMCVRQHTQDVHVCPSAHTGRPSVHISARWPFPWTVRVIWLTWAVCSVQKGRTWVYVSTHRTSVGVCADDNALRLCVPYRNYFQNYDDYETLVGQEPINRKVGRSSYLEVIDGLEGMETMQDLFMDDLNKGSNMDQRAA
ncbi:hypothetical protein YC2023_066312 [Brassica napus]